MWKRDGKTYIATLEAESGNANIGAGLLAFYEGVQCVETPPEPFKLRKAGVDYNVYTMFHPQLKDMIGTEGYFYNSRIRSFTGREGKLKGVQYEGFIERHDNTDWAYFAVPIKPEKTELTLHELLTIASDQLGVDVDSLRIKE